MVKKIVNSLLIFLLICSACKNISNPFATDVKKDTSVKIDTIVQAPPPVKEVNQIYTWVNELRMREEPTTDSPIVVTLKEGEPLFYKGEQSDFKERISLRGTLFNEPWLKVTTESGKEGWVYGGGVKFYKVGSDQTSTPYDDCLKLEKDRKLSQAEKCFERVQFRQLKENASLVTESAAGIDFNLLGGEKFSLQNKGRDTTYSFRYYIKNMGFFALTATYRDSSEYVLVNDKSGELVTMKGYPKASPEGNHIVGVGTDWKGMGDFNGIQMFSYTPEGFKLTFEENMIDVNPVSPKWIDDNTLQISLLQINNRRKSKVAQLTRNEAGEWSLDQ